MSEQVGRIALINASPRLRQHTASLLAAASEGITESGSGHQVDSFSLYGDARAEDRLRVGSSKNSGQPIRDWLRGLGERWQRADAIILGSPVYTFGGPSRLNALFDALTRTEAVGETTGPKPIGIVAQGGGVHTGAEVTAQTLMHASLELGCVPVSGDMPGSSQGVIGQVADGRTPTPELTRAARRLGVRVAEMTTVLQAGRGYARGPVRLLLASIGSATASQRQAIARAVRSGARSELEDDLVIEVFDSSECTIAPCRGCTDYCDVELECVYRDDMQAFRARWLRADAVVWIVEATHSAEAVLRAILDRMNQVRFATHFGLGQGRMPRYLKAVGLLTAGESPGRCFTVTQFLRQANLQYQSVLVTPPTTGFQGQNCITLRVGGGLPAGALEHSRAMGRRVVEVARTLQGGLEREARSLPGEYFPSRTTFGALEPIQERR